MDLPGPIQRRGVLRGEGRAVGGQNEIVRVRAASWVLQISDNGSSATVVLTSDAGSIARDVPTL